MTHADRIIVGSGFSGLLDALEAIERGENVVIVEATHHLGGVIQPTAVGDVIVDGGAEAFSTVESAVLDLVNAIGLGRDIVRPTGRPAHIIGPDQTTVIPEGIFGIPRDLSDPVVLACVGPEAVREARQRDAEPLPADWASLSVGDIVVSRLGESFLSHLVEPVITGVHGQGADQLDASLVIPQVITEAQECGSLVGAVASVRGSRPSPGQAVATVAGGLFRVPARLAEIVTDRGGRIMTGTRAVGMSLADGEWTVDTTSGVLHAPRVTLANGPAGQTELLRAAFGQQVISPGKPSDSHVVIARVHSTQLSAFPLGSGALVSGHRHDSIRATTHLNAKWDYVSELMDEDHHLIRFSTHPPTGTQHDVTSAVSSGLTDLYQVDDATILDAQRLSWPGSLLSPQQGHQKWLAENHPAWEAQGLSLRGALVTGNGLLGITNSNRKRQTA